MQYSVRTRRRLRPTRDLPPVPVTAGEVQGPIADGTGAVKQPMITQRVIERISPRAIPGCSKR